VCSDTPGERRQHHRGDEQAEKLSECLQVFPIFSDFGDAMSLEI